MKILMVNKFLFCKGGAEAVFLDTAKLLEDRGHEIVFFSTEDPRNADLPNPKYLLPRVDLDSPKSVSERLGVTMTLLYSRNAKRLMLELIEREKPDIAHLHNIYHQISPSIIDALRSKNVPMVMTLHDYKLTCPVYTLFSQGRVCEACAGGRFYNVLRKSCTRGSRFKSFVNLIEMYMHHSMLHVYDKVDCYVSPSSFLKNQTHSMGFRGRIVHIPNFIDCAPLRPSFEATSDAMLYLGRLSREKGVATLIEAAANSDVQLNILGDGPLRTELEASVRQRRLTKIAFLGYRRGDELLDEIRKSLLVVVPSEWYENNPRAILEAFALGKPVLGARIGGIPELVKDNETGQTFEPGDARDLNLKIRQLASDRSLLAEMGRNGRRMVERACSPDRHYDSLMSVYEEVMRQDHP